MKSNTRLVFALFLSVVLFSFSCADHTGGGNGNGNKPPSIVLTYPELIQMLKHYDLTRKDKFASAVNKEEDTRINFFRLQDLKDYIAYVEKESKKKGIDLTGINFISGAYPENYALAPEKSNYQNLIMMPATTVKGEEMVSFDPFRSEDGVPALLRDILMEYDKEYLWSYDTVVLSSSGKKQKKSRSTKSSGDKDLSPAGNRTGISPPN